LKVIVQHSLSIVLFAILTSCSFGEKKNAVQVTDQPEARASFVNYKIESIDENIGPCGDEDDLEKCLTFSVEYPVIEKGVPQTILQKLNDNIISDIIGSYMDTEERMNFDQIKIGLKSDFESLLKDYPESINNWNLEIISDILHQDSLFISLATTINSYTGGAHANYVQSYRSYDLRTGETIQLEDLFIEGFEEELNEYAEIEFRMNKQIPPSKSLRDEGFSFENDRFTLNQNFAIINRSMVFYFNPYEIAPYAMGPTELEMKLTDFVKWIKDGSVIESFKD